MLPDSLSLFWASFAMLALACSSAASQPDGQAAGGRRLPRPLAQCGSSSGTSASRRSEKDTHRLGQPGLGTAVDAEDPGLSAKHPGDAGGVHLGRGTGEAGCPRLSAR